MIPKVLFQTSVDTPEPYVVSQIRSRLGMEWAYEHYNDEQILQFFEDNPVEGFPYIKEKFLSLVTAHKADLFRMYYLYVKGGVFLDSDAIISTDIENITRDYDFFSVYSMRPGLVFNGFIGSIPDHSVTWHGLNMAYSATLDYYANDYYVNCRYLFDILQEDKWKNDLKIKMYQEYEIKIAEYNAIYPAVDEEGRIICIHYPITKVIPR